MSIMPQIDDFFFEANRVVGIIAEHVLRQRRSAS